MVYFHVAFHGVAVGVLEHEAGERNLQPYAESRPATRCELAGYAVLSEALFLYCEYVAILLRLVYCHASVGPCYAEADGVVVVIDHLYEFFRSYSEVGHVYGTYLFVAVAKHAQLHVANDGIVLPFCLFAVSGVAEHYESEACLLAAAVCMT